MSKVSPNSASELVIRPIQYRDLDVLERCSCNTLAVEGVAVEKGEQAKSYPLEQIKRWYGPLKLLSLFPNPLQRLMTAYVAEKAGHLCGVIKASPFNETKSTWQVDHVAVNSALPPELGTNLFSTVGSQLLRHCFEKIWEARTWLVEVDIQHKSALALYRQNGFQPLAQVTYWSMTAELLASLAGREPDLPNLLPVSNADAQLLYQLDTASVPPLVRQVFDRQIQDFKVGPLQSLTSGLKRWAHQQETVSAYVFEPQRKAAIGYFQLTINRQGTSAHQAQLTVHPAYTWLYPELIAQMARILQSFPQQPLSLASLDYQPEREEYLSQVGALPLERSLMMSRSVWHKLRESKAMSLEGLQLSDVLQGLQPTGKPVPGRFSWLLDQGSAILPNGISGPNEISGNSASELLEPSGGATPQFDNDGDTSRRRDSESDQDCG
ncbi:MAG: GNAT family N-acetyltransferase [Cyanobacteria bacterium P01_C01_bin.73]